MFGCYMVIFPYRVYSHEVISIEDITKTCIQNTVVSSCGIYGSNINHRVNCNNLNGTVWVISSYKTNGYFVYQHTELHRFRG